jgi:cytochrome oxidase assembly protein ShyY1
MWRSLFSPKWLFLHAAILSLVVLMTNLSFWQLHRLDAKKLFNKAVTSHVAEPVREISAVLTNTTSVKDVEWRRVAVKGVFNANDAVTVINRSQDGSAGYNSVVPLMLPDGTALLVNRGFVPLAMTTPDISKNEVTVIGYLRVSQERTGLGLKDSDSKDTTEFQRFDVPRIASQVDYTVMPMFLQLIQQDPAGTSQWPAPVALPPLDEGSHLSYAVQWLFFSLVALTAWIIVIRRKLRGQITDGAVQAHTSA